MITLVTGNKGKLSEWRRLLPPEFKLRSQDVDLEEIQSLDPIEIIRDKAKRAFEIVKSPVIVEDVSAGLDELNGLPGPFIKFFELSLGQDALFQLASRPGAKAKVDCAVAYYDGTNLISCKATETGQVIPPRGDNGFGFDICFVPTGQTKTYAEMTPSEKDGLSHRAKAVHHLTKLIAPVIPNR